MDHSVMHNNIVLMSLAAVCNVSLNNAASACAQPLHKLTAKWVFKEGAQAQRKEKMKFMPRRTEFILCRNSLFPL